MKQAASSLIFDNDDKIPLDLLINNNMYDCITHYYAKFYHKMMLKTRLNGKINRIIPTCTFFWVV